MTTEEIKTKRQMILRRIGWAMDRIAKLAGELFTVQQECAHKDLDEQPCLIRLPDLSIGCLYTCSTCGAVLSITSSGKITLMEDKTVERNRAGAPDASNTQGVGDETGSYPRDPSDLAAVFEDALKLGTTSDCPAPDHSAAESDGTHHTSGCCGRCGGGGCRHHTATDSIATESETLRNDEKSGPTNPVWNNM